MMLLGLSVALFAVLWFGAAWLKVSVLGAITPRTPRQKSWDIFEGVVGALLALLVGVVILATMFDLVYPPDCLADCAVLSQLIEVR